MKRKNIKITPKVFRFSSDKPTRIFPFQVISLIRPPGLPAEIADRRISRILLDCMKQLFSGYGKHKTTKKRACAQPLSFSHYLFINSPIHYLAKPLYNLAKPYTIWRNYQFLPDCMGVLPKGFTFAKSYEVLPKGFTFAKLYPTFAKSFILFGKRTPEQKFVHSRM